MSSKLYTKEGVSDLVLLEEIKEENILGTLRIRHKKDLIYTYIGSVLISVNPFKDISNLYSNSEIAKYKGRYMYELQPHVFALAEDTYRTLLTERENQCVIISGESGAGKTEASKKIMQYIAAVSGSGTEIERVKNQILQSNPVLESFGNAKTVRNNNSSRFGKYMEIDFDWAGDPVGGRITNYLLEKSRVVQPAVDERSFHVFYQLCAGLSKEEKKSYHLFAPENYTYLSQSGCFKVDRMNDKAEFDLMVEGMVAMGMTGDEIGEVFRIVSAVLWIGQVEFKDSGDRAQIVDESVLNALSDLLGSSVAVLRDALTSRTIETGMDSVKSHLDSEKAYYTRDALAKVVYFRLFDYVVSRVNRALDTANIQDSAMAKDLVTVGVLDIYGFEIFERNSFEQFCINFVNEKLQQIFIEKTLKSEQDEYAAENIQWVPVEYFNNKIVCDLIEKRPRGLMAFLDEDCLLGRGTDATFMEKITNNFKAHNHFEIPSDHLKGSRLDFVVKHYAGDVRYNVEGFIDKNKDLVWKDLLLIGETSTSATMKAMFPPGAASAMGKKRPVTAGYSFVKQVNVLMDTLSNCTPHYIRCIKPNNEKRAGLFDDALTLHQVRYLGLLENVRVRRAGFAFRMTFTRFLARYKMLTPDTWPHFNGDAVQGCSLILRSMGLMEGSQYQLGRTKIFIRQPVSLFTLEELRERKLHDLVTLIQKVYRAWKARKYFLELREKSLGLFGKNKLRRRISVRRYYVGDYLNASNHPVVRTLMNKNGERRVLFLDEIDKVNRKYKVQRRVVLLTDAALYYLSPGSYKVKRRVELKDIASASVSTKADNYVSIHVSNSYDMLVLSERKTEFLTALNDQIRELTRREFPIAFKDEWQYHEGQGLITKKRDPVARTITFVAGSGFEGTKMDVDVNNNKRLIITVGEIDTVNAQYLANIAPVKMTSGGAKPAPGHRFGGGLANPERAPVSASPFLHHNTSDGKMAPPPRPNRQVNRPNETWVKAIASFQGQDEAELSFNEGDIIRILKQEPDGWWSAELDGKLGYVPKTYVEVIERTERSSSRINVPLPAKPY